MAEIRDLAGCRPCTRRSEIVVPMITHSDWFVKAFWQSLATGITRASNLYGITSVLIRPLAFSPANEAVLVNAAAKNYSLMGTTSIPADLANVGVAVKNASLNGTTVISFNVGDLFIEQDAVMHHIGQPESIAGFKMGAALAALGSRAILCVMHQIGSVTEQQRCQGAMSGALSVAPLANFTTITADGTSIGVLKTAVNYELDSNPALDGMISLGQDVVDYYVAVLATRGQTASVRLATFDVNLSIIAQMQRNQLVLCLNQQQVLQGFGTMLLLKTFYMTRGQKLMTKLLLAGPALVTPADAPAMPCRLNSTLPGCVTTAPSSVTIGVVSLTAWSISDAFTQQAQFGVLNAAREHGVHVKFLETGLFDLQALALQVQTAISTRSISALVVPIPSRASAQDYGALADLAAAASIPVFSYGTGAILGADKVSSGAIKFHLGQDESVSGARFGARLNELMAAGTQVLCLSLEFGNDDMQLKCAGIQSALTGGRSVIVNSGNSLVLTIAARNALLAQQTLVTALNSNPNIGAIVFPNAEMARTVVAALATSSRASSPPILAGYGYNLDVAEMIRAGTVAFTADEQPFLQLYLATVFASYYLTDGLVLTNPLLETGPNFIDQTTLPAAIC
ncbi:periplasmic binding protein-like I, partial [Blastocladiella britannica]